MDMKVYVLSLAAGILVGVIYALLGVRSPAPPIVALVGLLGILVGEQLEPLAANLWRREASFSWHKHVDPHVFSELPKGFQRVKGTDEDPIDDAPGKA
jgi:XapX domain-containing protein